MVVRAFAVLAVFALGVSAAPARADEHGRDIASAEVREDELAPERRLQPLRPWHVEGRFGFSTLVGSAGVTLGYDVVERLQLGAGIGWNLVGPIGGVYARYRPLMTTRRNRSRHALTAELGLSAGGYVSMWTSFGAHTPAEEIPRYSSDLALWGQFELAWERRSPSGFMLRIGGGAATLLNPDSVECEIGEEFSNRCTDEAHVLPVIVVGVGQTF